MGEGSSLIDPASHEPIRDAACVVVIDTSASAPKVLMGRRHADQVFLPDKWVFPGGRVESGDRALSVSLAGPYTPIDLSPSIRPFALAALRELREETGLLIGSREPFDDGAHPGWREFAKSGHAPSPARLLPLARAITPPGRVRRYDTWFFMAGREAVSDETTLADGELLDLDWFNIADARKLDLPHITRLVLEDVFVRIESQASHPEEQLPFYYSDACGFQRALISCRATPSPP